MRREENMKMEHARKNGHDTLSHIVKNQNDYAVSSLP